MIITTAVLLAWIETERKSIQQKQYANGYMRGEGYTMCSGQLVMLSELEHWLVVHTGKHKKELPHGA